MFKFSIVTPVYNVAPFLAEAIESVIHQDIGFEENAELILVDDGSTDGSAAICDEYAAKYPRNIKVIHKENGGVSSARNEGLRHIEGEFVGFLDADDKYAENTFREVYDFFTQHFHEVDLVSIPIYFFDDRDGSHVLNYKFKRGSRVIDLLRDYDAIQLSFASAFVKANVARTISFDSRLKIAEDAEEVLKILCRKYHLGVCSRAKYLYRKRARGEASAIDGSLSNKAWYMPYLNYFSLNSLKKLRDADGHIPRFVQFTVMYDLQWRIKGDYKQMCQTLPEEEMREWKETLYRTLSYIDYEIILRQKNLWAEHKAFALAKKYGAEPKVCDVDGRAMVMVNGIPVCDCTRQRISLELMSLEQDAIVIEGHTLVIGARPEEVEILWGSAEGELTPCHIFPERTVTVEALGEPIMYKIRFAARLPLAQEKREIKFYVRIGELLIEKRKVQTHYLFPINRELAHAYVCHQGRLIRLEGNRLIIEPVGFWGHVRQEARLLRDIWRQGPFNSKLAVGLRCLYHLAKPFKRGEIWLLSDRINKAGDNAEALFRYLQGRRVPAKVYYVLRRDSADYQRVRAIGHVLSYRRPKHLLMHLLADKHISAAADDWVRNPLDWQGRNFRDIYFRQQNIFLQHGVTKDDMSGWLNKYNKNLALFITAARPEYESILQGAYFYDESVVRLTGFARHDRLADRREKVITIMPTWRTDLCHDEASTSQNGVKGYNESFKDTDYFKFYNAFLNDKRLLEACQRLGYRLRFMPHPNVMPVISWFDRAEGVEFCDFGTAYSEIFATSALIVTDYSSAAMDFAYMRKPVVYAQFDAETFWGHQIYEPGYFDYVRDGFGEVEYDLDSTVARLIEYMEHGCELKEMYRERIERFFAFHDRESCRRITDDILALK